MRPAKAVFLGSIAVFALRVGVAQTARQGESKTGPEGFQEFHTPMILEVPLPVASLPATTVKKGAWLTTPEFGGLRKYRCDKISIVSLEMNQREPAAGKVEINTRVRLLNPDQNHDKKVTLLFQVVNGDEVSGSYGFQAVKVKEGAMVTKTLKTTLPSSALVQDQTKLRITMTTWDY